MSHQILRTFHPVGQGAFYSERHNDFNIVYDCGAMPYTKETRELVRSIFRKSDDIDALFISHFDYDHVSAISALKDSVERIKVVVMPLLHDEDKHLLINVNRAMSQNIVKLLTDPQSFFGKKTTIVYVKPGASEESKNNEDDDSPQRYDLRELRQYQDKVTGNVEIESGAKLSLGGILGWIFVPYNFCNAARSSQLEHELNIANFDVNQLKANPKYGINAIADKNTRKALRKAYSRVDGNVNENSMLLYSGPEFSNEKGKWCICDECYDDCSWPRYCNYKPGCIYTGDSDLNKLDLKSIYSEFAINVGVIQIPHHGSKHNFAIRSLSGFWHRIVCPISVGTKNNYGHPAFEVINHLSNRGYSPWVVTEQSETEFAQRIVIADKKAKFLQKNFGAF